MALIPSSFNNGSLNEMRIFLDKDSLVDDALKLYSTEWLLEAKADRDRFVRRSRVRRSEESHTDPARFDQ